MDTHIALAETFLETAVLAVERGFEPAAYENALHALVICMRGAIARGGGNRECDLDHLPGEFARLHRGRVAPLVLRQITSFIEDVGAPLSPEWSSLPSDELHHRVTRIGELVSEVFPDLLRVDG